MWLFDALSSALDFILPRRERRRRTEARTLSDIALAPASHELFGKTVMTLMDYREQAAADLIQSLKYDASGHAARLCAAALADFLREEILSARTFSPERILLVPVPLHRKRLHERGFNQIEKVLRCLSAEFREGTLALLEAGALVRTRATKAQTRLSRKERLTNVAGAFAADGEAVRGSHIFLIDDVTTTGATLTEAAKPLQKTGAAVTLIALARA